MTTALIDADIIAFRSAAAIERNADELALPNPADAFAYADVMVREWTKYVKPNKIIMCFSDAGRKYFRNDIYPEYKANRAGLERPSALTETYEYLADKYSHERRPGLEADDLLGIFGTHPDVPNPVVISIDKDMMTLPVKYLNPDKMRRPIKINKASADYAMLLQSMIGDSTDNYKGIPGIGKVKAAKIVGASTNPSVIWKNIQQAFIDNHLTVEYAITMVRLARILRFEDYNFETGEVRLWHPSKPEWITPLNQVTTSMKMESKPSITSSRSQEDSTEPKVPSPPTSLSTSLDSGVRATPPKISKKQNGISTGLSKKSKKTTVSLSSKNVSERTKTLSKGHKNDKR